MPLASIQPHRPDSSRLCSSANIIEATPSITKNTMRTNVRERTPLNGRNRSMIPAAIPRIAETSDHQKPGTLPIPKVVIQPAIPLMRKSQPTRISTASVAIDGIAIAARPRMTRMIPSTRKSTQCSCSDVAAASLILLDVGLVHRHGKGLLGCGGLLASITDLFLLRQTGVFSLRR
jgi:hypothetical protein